MGYVYLIGENNDLDHYKIGCTNKKKIEGRINELQTGNPNELILVKYYETDKPYKLEMMLHNHFKYNNDINEWFSLNKDDVDNFKNICDKYQNIIDSLKDNPFF